MENEHEFRLRRYRSKSPADFEVVATVFIPSVEAAELNRRLLGLPYRLWPAPKDGVKK